MQILITFHRAFHLVEAYIHRIPVSACVVDDLNSVHICTHVWQTTRVVYQLYTTAIS